MTSLLLRNLFFTILQPGLVAGLIPYWIVQNFGTAFPENWSVWGVLGVLVFAFGFVLMVKCILQFALEGKGTLSPADPTRQLVAKGLYKYTRNPMYVGVLLMLAGETLFFQLWQLAIYSVLIALFFHLFVLLFEEPRLRKDFGQDYIAYSKKVKRWF